ncbi:hypothetical protein [Jeotgalibacillus salarius]|uniref:Uncharacterized protein n=1 Tax=Jeotgalibacillus salarius TaxID=546023 RepID=A0A4Y8LGW0_9BACL|nr:hypothetical protein [Jeotgalibacillus salarius]TFE02040.1 hypothetical protein E2626_05550 [Jeotgalibacillus salarius]
MKLKKSAKIGLAIISLSAAALITVNAMISIPSFDHEDASSYLEKEVAEVNRQGVVTDAFKVFGGNDEELYIWYSFEEFLVEKNDHGTSGSLAVKLFMENGKVIGHELPAEGELYTDSMKKLFPWHVRWRMPNGDVPSSIEREIDIQQSAIIAELEESEDD